jgi:flagellar biosynthesis protein FlhG
MFDQAQSLRLRIAKKNELISPTKVYAVTSGKGGVGKSNFTLNFALALIEQGLKVVIIDADLGFANLDVLMGKTSSKTMLDLANPGTTIWDVLEDGPGGLQFIAGGSGFQELIHLSNEQIRTCLEKMASLQGYADVVLIDTGAGLNEHNLQMILAADEIILISTPEPTAMTDAYALVKMVSQRQKDISIRLVINRAANIIEGRQTAEKLTLVSRRFLDIQLATLGYLLDDPYVGKAVLQQVPHYLLFPSSTASRCIQHMVASLLHHQDADDVRLPRNGGMKGFIRRMVSALVDGAAKV